MRMKPFFQNHKLVSRAKAKNAALLNLLATPGLGSLLCGRWIIGIAQLFLALTGCALILVWFFKILFGYYGLMSGQEQPEQSVSTGWIGVTGGILLAVSWLWSAFTSISLMHEASIKNAESLKNFAAPPLLKLETSQIISELTSIPNWKQNGDVISRTFQFKDFLGAIKFVNAVAEIAETAWHHPDIDIRWNKVTLALTTHDAEGLTEKDFALAKKFDKLSLR
jgi:4a-hydroxytetrahydrobiopterin dehydratase